MITDGGQDQRCRTVGVSKLLQDDRDHTADDGDAESNADAVTLGVLRGTVPIWAPMAAPVSMTNTATSSILPLREKVKAP